MIERFHGATRKILIVPGVHHFGGLGNHPLIVLEALKADGVQVIFAPHVE
jgi:hypothetical protein